MESWTVLGWLLAVSTLGAQERMRIAVADFNAIDAKPSLGLSVAELMRTELVNKNVFTILERAQMEKVLKEQGFQRTGVREVESAVEMGRLLAAKKILVGTVSRFGATYTINCRIIGVEKGVAEFASSVQAANEEEMPAKVAVLATASPRGFWAGLCRRPSLRVRPGGAVWARCGGFFWAERWWRVVSADGGCGIPTRSTRPRRANTTSTSPRRIRRNWSGCTGRSTVC